MLEILHTVLLLRCDGRENLPPKAAKGHARLDTNTLPTLAGRTGEAGASPRGREQRLARCPSGEAAEKQ